MGKAVVYISDSDRNDEEVLHKDLRLIPGHILSLMFSTTGVALRHDLCYSV
jgi:hypothetical protein